MSSLSINLSPSHFCVSFNIRREVFLISRNRRNCTPCRPLGRKRTRAPITKRRQRGAADVRRSRKRRRRTCYIYRWRKCSKKRKKFTGLYKFVLKTIEKKKTQSKESSAISINLSVYLMERKFLELIRAQESSMGKWRF